MSLPHSAVVFTLPGLRRKAGLENAQQDNNVHSYDSLVGLSFDRFIFRTKSRCTIRRQMLQEIFGRRIEATLFGQIS
jgi:hypothetical protein